MLIKLRNNWQVRRLLLSAAGDQVVLRPGPEDPISAVSGKYSWITKTADEMQAEDRENELDR